MRVWALVTQTMDVYFFAEGYMRLSSSEFSTDEDQLDNLFIHLTNNAIQKYSETYGQFENGNMWTFDMLFDFLEGTRAGGDAYAAMTAKDYKKVVVQKMKDIIWLTFSAVKKKLNKRDRKHCFEIFGFDFLLDELLNTWLIEVNTNPAIEECSQLLKALVPRCIGEGGSLLIALMIPPPFS